jgi:hypothetical protein
MARRAVETEGEVLRAPMARHLRQLGFKDPQSYFVWCAGAGVALSLDKSAKEREREIALEAKRKAAIDARVRVHRNPRRFLVEACAGRVDPATVERPGWREVAAAIAGAKDKSEGRQSLADFLLHLERVSDLVFAVAATRGRQPHLYLEGLIKLHERKGLWLRDPLVWRPTSHNSARQFSSLARHLLAKFDVPVFLDSAWFRSGAGAHRFRDWFVHIARGLNIRTAKTPYPMTKMIAHHFVHAPDDATIEGALMLADIKALGGTQRVATALGGTRLGQRIERDPERRAFWLSVYRFFIANPMLDLRHAGPIVDFLAFQKFETQEVLVGPGRVEMRPPPQPNLTMARRTVESLLRQVEAWHGELRTVRANDTRFWRASGVAGFAMQTGPRDRPAEQVLWQARELLSGRDLIDNGRRMRHCVASYAASCARGSCSIWSLDRMRAHSEERESVLTVEIDANGVLVQARGYSNRWPDAQERGILDAWMRKAGLKAGPYLFGS